MEETLGILIIIGAIAVAIPFRAWVRKENAAQGRADLNEERGGWFAAWWGE
jgi:hypothetical protein